MYPRDPAYPGHEGFGPRPGRSGTRGDVACGGSTS